jgi:uncharacterized protein with HEPN domain
LIGIAPLPSKKPARRLRDIIENAEAILDSRAAWILPREAATKLGDLATVLMPNQPWADIRGIGNYLRHQYDDIDQQQVWEIVQVYLRPLRDNCKEALGRLSDQGGE